MTYDESQVESSQSDSQQDSAMEQGQQTMPYETKKRGKQFWILMAPLIAALIIGFVVMIRKNRGNDESPDATLSGNERQNEPSRIIGGSQSYQNQFPYYVDTGECGGALIAPRIVLSAAHCGTSKFQGNKLILNGSQRGKVGTYGKLISWSRWVAHPGYSESGIGPVNDFALFLLDKPEAGSISLNQNPSFPADGSPGVAIGVGVQNRGTQLVKGVDLQDVVIPVHNAEECKENLGSFFNTDVMMCAGTPGKGICYGDSGGPLVVRNGSRDILVGITSMIGHPECSKFHKYDNIFARTSGAFHWIKNVVCDQWGQQADFCSTCSDKPGWTDSTGYDCGSYIYTEATGVRICEYHKDLPGAGGLTPVQACCVCNYVSGGQGSNTNPPPTTTGSCSDSTGWTDPNGYDCTAYASTEATGVRICEYHKGLPGASGLTPVQACCVCNYVNGGQSSNSNPPPAAGSCADSTGWTDPNGYDCSAYAATEATGTPVCEYHRDIPGAGGLTPVQACCVCK